MRKGKVSRNKKILMRMELLKKVALSLSATSTNVGRYKGRTLQRSDSDSTNVRLTDVGMVLTTDWYKRRTRTNVGLVQRSDSTNVGSEQTSNWYKRRTRKNVGLVQTSYKYKRRTLQRSDSTNVGSEQTSNWYKRRTRTNVGLVQTSYQYKRRTITNVGQIHL